nr:hypothetical protein Iba_chr07fCG7930 [Ipomoea batatas]
MLDVAGGGFAGVADSDERSAFAKCESRIIRDSHFANAFLKKGDEWGTVRNATDSNTSSPQPPRKYGEWMLVTRKSVAQDRNKVNDEGGESLPPTSGRTTVEQTRRNKGKDAAPNGRLKGTASRVSPQGTRTYRQQTKGKAKNSNHHNTSETSVPTMSQQPPSVPSNSNKVATHERSVPTSTTSLSPRPSQQEWWGLSIWKHPPGFFVPGSDYVCR